jgi:RND family efflux transporter MFP subunit
MFQVHMRIAGMIALAGLMAGCSNHEAPAKEAESGAPIAVKTVPAASVEWPLEDVATGTVRARTATSISAKVMGYVREVRVGVGDRVREGQTLVVIEARDLDTAVDKVDAMRDEVASALPEAENGIAAARAQMDLAQATFKRMEELFQKKSISHQEYDEASARLASAKANHEMALSKRKQLLARAQQVEQERRSAEILRGHAEVKAPYAGTITARQAEPGTLATPGAPLLTVERAGAYRLEAQVQESLIGRIRQGQTVQVEMEALRRTFPARVGEIVPSVDAVSRAYTVKIDLPGAPDLRSGMFGRVRFATGARQVVTMPESALMERGQLQSVMVAEAGIARSRLITTGARRNGSVEVLSGLSAGDAVIMPVPAGLMDGAKVEARP